VRRATEHLDAAYRLARAIVRDPSLAQDATHDAFVQAWQKWPSLRDVTRFEAATLLLDGRVLVTYGEAAVIFDPSGRP